MLLADCDLRVELADGGLAIDPYDARLLQPSSIDVLLGSRFLVFNSHSRTHIDPTAQPEGLYTEVKVGEDGFVLHPGEFVLGATLETITLGTSLAARLEGKSSLGRLGLLVHSTAGFVDPGFSGSITLELSNVATLPILLRPGMKIGQLCVFRTSSPVTRPYGTPGLGSRYQGQDGPTASRSHQDYTHQ